jgi:serine/threonine protein kinase
MKTHSDIFEVARQLPEHERDAYLAEACENSAQRERVEALLVEAGEADAFFAEAAAPGLTPPPAPPVSEKAGDEIGPYILRQQIGEGGFGTVWMAEQKKPIARMVALKVVKPGMDTQQVLARFGAERQALTMMDHPNIAKVLDAGATEAGRPYFAMELVRGLPITEFCDRQKLDTRARIELFKDVCSAVNHAHQKGIIHRDLKPSNILVSLHGDKPVPKVIDFGIAKAMHGKLTEQTLFTRFEQFMGTPLYMSPEQAELSGLDIDTRSDIYSLGVLLYEILAGQPPFDAGTLLNAGYDEMRRMIREVEPPRPSVRLTGLTLEQGQTLTTAHQTQPEKLGKLLKGELDWVIMKAIEKDRGRRYETAAALATDLERYLSDEPVAAAAPSRAYKFRKFVRRNKGVLAATAAVLLALVVGMAVSAWQMVRAAQAEVDSIMHMIEKEQAREEAEDLGDFLLGVLQNPDPNRDGRTITMLEVLDDAAKRLDTELEGQPARKAELRESLGRTYYFMGFPEKAVLLQEEALQYHLATSGPKSRDTIWVMHNLAFSYWKADRRDESMKMQEELVELRTEVQGAKDIDTIIAIGTLAASYHQERRFDEAIALLEKVVTLAGEELGEKHTYTLRMMESQAIVLEDAGRTEEAEALRREVAELEGEAPESE